MGTIELIGSALRAPDSPSKGRASSQKPLTYGTTEGKTAEIAHHVADVARKADHSVDLVNALEIEPTTVVDDYAAMLIGAAGPRGSGESALGLLLRLTRRVQDMFMTEEELLPS